MKDRSDEQLSLVIEEIRSRETCYPLLRSVWLVSWRLAGYAANLAMSPSVWLVACLNEELRIKNEEWPYDPNSLRVGATLRYPRLHSA